jgi:hypothetical protein
MVVICALLATGLAWLIVSALREAKVASERYDQSEDARASSEPARDP